MMSVCLSVCHVDSSMVFAWIDVALGLCTAVVSGMRMHVSIKISNWAHERFKHPAVVLFAIIFGRVKF